MLQSSNAIARGASQALSSCGLTACLPALGSFARCGDRAVIIRKRN